MGILNSIKVVITIDDDVWISAVSSLFLHPEYDSAMARNTLF